MFFLHARGHFRIGQVKQPDHISGAVQYTIFLLGGTGRNVGGFCPDWSVAILRAQFGCSAKQQRFFLSVHGCLRNIIDGADQGRNFLKIIRGADRREVRHSIGLLSQRGRGRQGNQTSGSSSQSNPFQVDAFAWLNVESKVNTHQELPSFSTLIG